jgi:hypothetical protein
MSSLAVTGAFLQARMSTQAQSSNDSSYPIPPNLAPRRQYIHPRVPSANPSIPTDDLSKSRILSTSPANESYTSYPTPPIPPRPSPTKSDQVRRHSRVTPTPDFRNAGNTDRWAPLETVFNCRIPSSTAGYRLQLQDTICNCGVSKVHQRGEGSGLRPQVKN